MIEFRNLYQKCTIPYLRQPWMFIIKSRNTPLRPLDVPLKGSASNNDVMMTDLKKKLGLCLYGSG